MVIRPDTTAVLHFVETIAAESRLWFTLRECMSATRLTEETATEQLKNLGPAICRVPDVNPLMAGNAFFVMVPEAFQRFGVPPLDFWLDDYFKSQMQPYYLCLLSAAQVYGVSRPPTAPVQIMTDRPTKSLQVGLLKMAFFVNQYMASTNVIQVPGAHGPLWVSGPTATFTELLAYDEQLGEALVTKAIVEMIAAEHACQAQAPQLSFSTMSDSVYCYHCGVRHPSEEMRQVSTRGGLRWRCIKSIQAARLGAEARASFGKSTTAINKASAQSIKSRLPNPERNSHG